MHAQSISIYSMAFQQVTSTEIETSKLLLQSDDKKLVIYPFSYDDNMKAQQNGKRQFVGHSLAFFAAAGGVINGNLVQSCMAEVQAPEFRRFYGLQASMESTHDDNYHLLVNIRK